MTVTKKSGKNKPIPHLGRVLIPQVQKCLHPKPWNSWDMESSLYAKWDKLNLQLWELKPHAWILLLLLAGVVAWLWFFKNLVYIFAELLSLRARSYNVDIAPLGTRITKPPLSACAPGTRNRSVIPTSKYFIINLVQQGFILLKLPGKRNSTPH